MAVPTITSVTPVSVSTQGWTYVEIVGTNFKEPTLVLIPGVKAAVPPPSVAVTFGTVPALEVGWLSSTLLYAVTPQTAPGLVSLTVSNLNTDGTIVPGETVVKPAAVTFSRPNIRYGTDLYRIVTAFVQLLINQVFGNTIYEAPQVDYAPTGATLPLKVKMPYLTVAGPTIRQNQFYTRHGNGIVPLTKPNDAAPSWAIRKRGDLVDLIFRLNAASASKNEMLGMRSALLTFFRNNTSVSIPRDVTDPSKGTVSYELYPDGEGMRDTSALSVSNVNSFALGCYILGFEVENVLGQDGTIPGDSLLYKGGEADTVELLGYEQNP